MINAKAVLLLTVGVLFMVLALHSLRRQHLKERYAILFVFVGLPFLVLAVWQDGAGRLAQLLGIDYRTVQVIGLGVFCLLMIFKLLSIVSIQDRRIAELAQLVGILMEKQKRTEEETRGVSKSPGPESRRPQGPA